MLNLSQNNWLSATRANGFAHHDKNRHTNNASGFQFGSHSSIGGNGPATTNQNDWLGATSAYGFSRLIHGGRTFLPSSTDFQPRGSSITHHGAGGVLMTKNNKVIPTLHTQFKPRGSDIEATSQVKGSGGKETETVFRKGRLWSSNYNLPKVHGPAVLYGNATLGLNTDLGINKQPNRQAFMLTGL
jgi:hypothetical protein